MTTSQKTLMQVTTVLTPYDLRYGRFRYLPAAIGRIVPMAFGYFMVIEGQKG